ncbi:Alcohol dehydrogenase [Granulibacter bethesdensis]|uniref:zinc-dependent alcohol dehydrogenase family protein n=1 Tax=Granulibacter bethesdensis TaxID=364410 RepID=UPI00090C638D|nr:NAD(P)-dependent alcohol dehydrogenase [Granulibacter bethesdensis]APH55874.1 Alcohol dehydrogenase [Granulibacter bethesdensis]
MKLYRLPGPHGIVPQGFDSLYTTEAPEPKPRRGQVLVRLRAASLNYRDLLVARGQYPLSPVPPDLIPLSDGAGEVIETGEDVTRFQPGDRVAPCFFQSWHDGPITERDGASALGGAIHGVLTEYAVFEQDGLVRIPDHLSWEEAACLPCAAVTAWHALFGSTPVQPGQTVLTQGTGGVSIFAIQFAKAAGARVITTSSSDKKLSRAQALGADEGINYRSRPDWHKAATALTGGLGVDHVVEVGGAGTLWQSIRAARLGGQIHLIGVLSGQNEINPMPLMARSQTLRGIYVGSRAMFEAMNIAISQHRIKPVIDRVFPFAEAVAAYRHLESATHLGKVVIRLDE